MSGSDFEQDERKETPDASGGTQPLQKQILRRVLLARRNRISPDVRRERSARICAHVVDLSVFRCARQLFLFYPVGSEPNMLPLADYFWQDGTVPVGFPVCDEVENKMDFRQVKDKYNFAPGRFGIPRPPKKATVLQPDRRTVCIVPVLAFDKNFHRLGYGRGFYDRYLKDFPGITVGVCLDRFCVDADFAEPHDIPLDAIVTEKRTSFNPRSPKYPLFE